MQRFKIMDSLIMVWCYGTFLEINAQLISFIAYQFELKIGKLKSITMLAVKSNNNLALCGKFLIEFENICDTNKAIYHSALFCGIHFERNVRFDKMNTVSNFMFQSSIQNYYTLLKYGD